MTKEQILFIRNEYKDKPMVITMGGTSTFFMDNYPERFFLIWDDDNELVTSIESRREASGMSSADYPFNMQICPYSDIESIRIIIDRAEAIDFFKNNKSSLTTGKYDYNIDLISKAARNCRPNTKPYYTSE